MTAHPPPVPPDQRPRKGGDVENVRSETDRLEQGAARNRNTAEQGQPANTKQNTTNQGFQQDR